MTFSWTQAPDLMKRLTDGPEPSRQHQSRHQDIMTWAGLCDTRAELEAHVTYYETRAAEYVAPKRSRRAA